MISQSAFPISLGPAEEAARSYWRASDVVFKGMHPVVKTALRANFEYAGFYFRQVRSASELPHEVAKCKSPTDMFGCVMRSWMCAFEDLAGTNERALSLVTATLPNLGGTDASIGDWRSPAADWREAETQSPSVPSPKGAERVRDRMDVRTQPQEAANWPARADHKWHAPADQQCGNVAHAA